MDPKILVVLGAGGFMCLLFVIIGIIAWVTSGDDDNDDDDKSKNSNSDNSGGENSGGDNSGGDNSGGDNSGGDNSGGENSGGNSDGSSNNGRCRGGLSQLGYAGSENNGTPANENQWALRNRGWGCVENPWNTDLEDEAQDCILRYAKNSNSSTGYSQCKWSNERVPEHGNVRCIPDTDNDCTPPETCGSKKCCEFTGKWQGQPTWSHSDELVENCNCREGDELTYHSGAGNSPHVWRCE